MSAVVDKLLGMTRAELEALFRASPAGALPRGEARGTVLVGRGGQLSAEAAKLVHLIAWQGKVFDPDRGELRNLVGPCGFQAVRAEVYTAPSWLDGRESIVLDYSRTSLVAHWIRDEIRQIGPAAYLGIVYWDRARLLDFVLEFPAPGGQQPARAAPDRVDDPGPR
jgi:hypothetical protein